MPNQFKPNAFTLRHSFLFISLLLLIGVIYSNFIPFNFSPSLSLSEVWDRFLQIPYVASRAGWQANLLLYIPPAFFLCGGLSGHQSGALAKIAGAIITLLFYSIVAISIEFFQIYFPPRTVTLNDIIAEISGTVLGIMLWLIFGARFVNVWQAIRAGGRPAILATLSFYVLGYVIFCLFPFDFIFSLDGLRSKLGSGIMSLLLAGSHCDSTFRCLAKPIAVVIVNMPIGILLGLLWGTDSASLRKILIFGLIASLFIELVKFFEESGIFQSLSILTRPLGMDLGCWLLQRLKKKPLRISPAAIRFSLILLLPFYLLALIGLNKGLNRSWSSWQVAREQLATVQWLPFYYHYFTPEANAMASLAFVAGCYAPLALGLWLWQGRPSRAGHLLLPALLAGGCALLIEAGKLFLSLKPDPTNILIAGCSASLVYGVAAWMQRWNQTIAPPRPAKRIINRRY